MRKLTQKIIVSVILVVISVALARAQIKPFEFIQVANSQQSQADSQPYVSYDWKVVIQTGDGGYALAGSAYGENSSDFGVVKVDSSGDIQWYKTYGEANYNVANSVIQTSDGGYALAGTANPSAWGLPESGDDAWLVKVDSSGNIQWSKTYGGANCDVGTSVIQTSDGGYALAGYTKSFGAVGYDFWLIKTAPNGNMLWNKTYGGTGDDEACSVVETNDGGYTLAGTSNSFGGDNNNFAWLVRTDSSGDMQWNQTYRDAGAYSLAYSISVTSMIKTDDNGYALGGSTGSYPSGSVFWLLKTNPAGEQQWTQSYADVIIALDAEANAVVQDMDGGYTIGGGARVYSGYFLWLLKVDPSGSIQWSSYNNTIGEAESMVQTRDGGYAVASLSGGIIKLDSSGTLQWIKIYSISTLSSTTPQKTSVPPSTNSSTSENQPAPQGIVISSDTNLTSDLQCAGLTINAGVTLTTNGFSILCSGTVINYGTIETGPAANSGASFPYSYGGSGGGGAGSVATPSLNPNSWYDIDGSPGGSTLAVGGAGATASPINGAYGPGRGGSTPIAPTLSNASIQTMYSKGFVNYLSGGSGGVGAVSGGSGGYGVYIQANTITNNGTINAHGSGGASGSRDLDGGGGGGGGGVIILAYGDGGVIVGNYNIAGGHGGVGGTLGNGGVGGNGQMLTYAYGSNPPILVAARVSSDSPISSNTLFIIIGVVVAVVIIVALVFSMFRKRLKTKPTSPLPPPPNSSSVSSAQIS